MSDERKPVICRYCGGAMDIDFEAGGWYGNGVNYRCAKCGSTSPYCNEFTEEAAYAAATQRPPNRALGNEDEA